MFDFLDLVLDRVLQRLNLMVLLLKDKVFLRSLSVQVKFEFQWQLDMELSAIGVCSGATWTNRVGGLVHLSGV